MGACFHQRFALARQRDQEIAEKRQRRILWHVDRRRAQTAATLDVAAEAANKLLKKRKLELKHLETVMETKHSMKRLSTDLFGKGRITPADVSDEAPLGSLGSSRPPRPGLASRAEERHHLAQRRVECTHAPVTWGPLAWRTRCVGGAGLG